MDKNSILQAISQALDHLGISENYDEFDETGGIGPANEVPIWSKLSAGELGQGAGPIHDKSALMAAKQAPEASQVDAYGMPVDDEAAEMMSAMGLV